MSNDFISRDAVLQILDSELGDDNEEVSMGTAREILRYRFQTHPAADVAPVVHERWMETPKDGWTRMECSGCGHSYYVPANINPIEWADDRNYCVKCGSRMDGGEHHA